MSKANDVFEKLTADFVRRIEEGKAGDWSKPWIPVGAGLPHNATTGKAYRGGNTLILWAVADACGWSGNAWATYKQWQEAGAQVRKGEKGTPLVKWVVRQCKHSSEERCDRCGQMFPSAFTVFHADQVDGWEPPQAEPLTPTERDEKVDEWFSLVGADVVHKVGDRAFYSPTQDRITMPEADQFHTTDGYYATLAHEHGHWTGHKDRLGRDLSGRFGSESYAMEELVAELTAAFVCSTLGVTAEPRKDHAAYLENWLQVLKGDSKALWAAASQAQRALDFMTEQAESREVVAAA